MIRVFYSNKVFSLQRCTTTNRYGNNSADHASCARDNISRDLKLRHFPFYVLRIPINTAGVLITFSSLIGREKQKYKHGCSIYILTGVGYKLQIDSFAFNREFDLASIVNTW